MINQIRKDKRILLRQLKNEEKRIKLRKVGKEEDVPNMNFKSNRRII